MAERFRGNTLDKYKKKKSKSKKKKVPDATAENGSDMDSIVLKDTTNTCLSDDHMMGGVAPEKELSGVPAEAVEGTGSLDSMMVTQSLPSPVRKQQLESIMMTSLPVQATIEDDVHFGLSSKNTAGDLEANQHISKVTSFDKPAGHYNSLEPLNNMASHNPEAEDLMLDDREAAVPSSLPNTTSSMNTASVPSGSVEDLSTTGQDIHFLNSRNQELQAANGRLGQELKELRDQKIELLNELESVRENCFADVERARREAASNFQHQIMAGQQALVESERRLHEVELQLEDSKRDFKQLEDRHAQDLLDRDQNHARNILNIEQKHDEELARVREETRDQPIVRDANEEAAEWMKLIKDEMLKKHDSEKQMLVKKHLDELKMQRDECQRKMNEQQQQIQTSVNEQLQGYYQQWMATSRVLEEQNKNLVTELEQTRAEVEQKNIEIGSRMAEVDRLAASLRNEEVAGGDLKVALASLEAKCASIAREKEVVEGECQTLLEEVRSLREGQLRKDDNVDQNMRPDSKHETEDSQTSSILERSIREWNEAASELDEKLSSPEKSEGGMGLEVRSKEELKALRSLAGEYEGKLMDSERHHTQELARYKEQLASMDVQVEEEREARKHLEGEVESLRLLVEEYEKQLRELKVKQEQEVLQVRRDAEKKISEALIKSQQEYDKKIGEVSAAYESEIENLKEANRVNHHQELQQLKEELLTLEQQRVDEKTASKDELESLQMLVEKQEQKLSDMEAMHTREVSQLQSKAETNLKEQLLETRQQNEKETDQVIARYEAEIVRLREANAAAMNESMDRASLEVAEEHMKSLREQLNGYRNQEQSYESRLTEMEKNHTDNVARILKQSEEEKNAAICQLEKEAASKVKLLEGKVASLAKEKEVVEVQFTARLKEAHQKDMEVLEANMKAKMEKAVADVRFELDAFNLKAIETLRQQLKLESESQKLELERNLLSKAEREREKLEGDIEELKAAHSLQVSKLNATISQAERVFSEKFSGKIASLQELVLKLEKDCEQAELGKGDLSSELAVLRQQKFDVEKALARVEVERNQLSEDCDRYQKRAKMLEVDASISKSAEENLQKVMEEKTELLEEKQAALDAKAEEAIQLASALEELRSRVTAMEEKTQALVAEKNCVLESLATKEEELSHWKAENERQLAEKQEELVATELRIRTSTEDLANKEGELQSSRDSLRSSLEQMDLMKKELEVRNAEYQTIIDQLAAKNQAFVDLQVENDSLKTSLDSLGKKYQDEVDAREELNKHLEQRWGESEEIESLKQQVMELSLYKDRYKDIMLKVESLGEEVSSKEKLLSEASQSLLQASQRNKHYEEENANYAKAVACLQQDLQQAEEAKAELLQQVQSVEAILGERSQAIKEMEKLIGELEGKAEQSERNAQRVVEEAQKEVGRVEEEVKDIGCKLKLAQNKEKLMLSELQEKEDSIRDLNTKLGDISRRSESQALKVQRQMEELNELTSKLDMASRTEEKLQSQLLSKERELSLPNESAYSNLESSSAYKEMSNEIESLHAKVLSLEVDVAGKNAMIEELKQAIEVLKIKLSVADDEVGKLEAEKSQLQQDFSQIQNDSRSTGAGEWPEKYSELEKVISSLKQDKEMLEAQLSDLRNRSSHVDDLEAKVKDQDKTIKDLRATLAGTTPTSSPNYKAQLGQDLLKNPLGATLTRARKTLAERLQERDAIEKELRFRRAKLERQLAEKQCLEHLLFEKKRFELELQNQKSLLKKELEELELKNIMGEKPLVK